MQRLQSFENSSIFISYNVGMEPPHHVCHPMEEAGLSTKQTRKGQQEPWGRER